MSQQQRLRGYLASPDGLIKLQDKKFEKGYSYETLAAEAGLASDDQVKRLFHPHWGRKVQIGTIEKIARVLDLKPVDIIDIVPANQGNPLPDKNQLTEDNIVVLQGELETQTNKYGALDRQLLGSTPLDSPRFKSQEMLTSVEVKSDLEVGDLIQKAQSDASSVEQKMATELQAESIKLGNLIQES